MAITDLAVDLKKIRGLIKVKNTRILEMSLPVMVENGGNIFHKLWPPSPYHMYVGLTISCSCLLREPETTAQEFKIHFWVFFEVLCRV